MAFDLDDEELKATREMYGLDKKRKANTDTAYCTNDECAKKCWRYKKNWKFNENENYFFIHKCL